MEQRDKKEPPIKPKLDSVVLLLVIKMALLFGNYSTNTAIHNYVHVFGTQDLHHKK